MKTSKPSLVMRWYRFMRTMHLKKVPIIPGLMVRLIRVVFACDLPYTCDLAEGVELCHSGLGVVIHDRAVVGKGTKIYQHVTLGGRDGRGHPTLGENVFVGPGVCILGGVTIGNNVRIGANAVVLDDLPENSVAVGIPAKVIKTIVPDTVR